MSITGRLVHRNAAEMARLVLIVLLMLNARTGTMAAADSFRTLWVPDNGDGTYRNPVIFADYSDPDVVRHGRDYYLVSSSFNCVPGLPILHSADLVNWRIVGHAIDRLPSPRYDRPRHGEGCWAPSIRYHEGEYWIYYGDPDLGIFMV